MDGIIPPALVRRAVERLVELSRSTDPEVAATARGELFAYGLGSMLDEYEDLLVPDAE